MQHVKEALESVHELVQSAGWPTPPIELMQLVVDNAADAKTCISFDIFVRYDFKDSGRWWPAYA